MGIQTSGIRGTELAAAAYGGLIREDVMDKIWDISNVPLPLTSLIGKETATNPYKEWTVDALANPDTANNNVDGADAGSTYDTATGDRLGNHCQIADKLIKVSQRADNTKNIGRSKELAYQLSRRQIELRRDVEAICLFNQASRADNGTLAGLSAGLPAWIATNDSFGAGGASGGFNTGTGIVAARTVSTTKRALSEAEIRTQLENIYNAGGEASVMMARPEVVGRFSKYLFGATTVAQIQSDQGKSKESAAALGSINVFVTDFGTLKIVPNRLQPTHTSGSAGASNVFLIDPNYLAIAYLHGYKSEPLAKAGLSDKYQLSVDFTLMVMNEKAHGLIADIDGSVAATA